MSINYWSKSIQNPDETPWLHWIKTEKKTFEGRLAWKDWSRMKIGDVIDLYCDNENVLVRIITIERFTDFSSAFEAHGEKLVPGVNSNSTTVADLYRKIYSDYDVKLYGVLLFGIKVIN